MVGSPPALSFERILVSRSHMTAVDLTLLDDFSTLATSDGWSGVRIWPAAALSISCTFHVTYPWYLLAVTWKGKNESAAWSGAKDIR